MTYADAKDELFGIVNTAIKAAIASRIIERIKVHYPGMNGATEPPNDGYWCRVFYTTIRDNQASLAKLNGISRYEALGQLVIQIYSPISAPGSLDNGNLLAESVRDAYRLPSPSGVMSFTNQLVRELGNTKSHYLTTVMVECTYDNYQ